MSPRSCWTAALFLAPALILLGVFVIYPIVAAGWISLIDWHGFNPVRPFIGLGNYVRLVARPRGVERASGDRYFMPAASVLLSVVTGLAVALLLDAPIRGLGDLSQHLLPARDHLVGRRRDRVALHARPGRASSIRALGHIGIAGPDWLNNRWLALLALILLTVWKKTVGFNAILYLTAMQALPEQVFDAAKIDGANARQRVLTITVPLLRPMTFFVVVQALITSFQSFDLVYVLTGGGPSGGTETIGMLMYRNAFRLGDYSYGTAIAFVSLVLVPGRERWCSGAPRAPGARSLR